MDFFYCNRYKVKDSFVVNSKFFFNFFVSIFIFIFFFLDFVKCNVGVFVVEDLKFFFFMFEEDCIWVGIVRLVFEFCREKFYVEFF